MCLILWKQVFDKMFVWEFMYMLARLLQVLSYTFSQALLGLRICLSMQDKQELQVSSLGGQDSLEEEMATHSSILVWIIPRTKEPGRL